MGGLGITQLFQIGMMGYQMYQANQQYKNEAASMKNINAEIGSEDTNKNTEVSSDGKIDAKANFLKSAGSDSEPKKINGLGGFSS